MSTARNLNTVNAAITLLLNLTQAAARVSAMIGQARAEGREELTAEEEQLLQEDDVARAGLVGAIEAAKSSG